MGGEVAYGSIDTLSVAISLKKMLLCFQKALTVYRSFGLWG